MKELTFVGFLSLYVRELSMSGTNSISKLASEAATDNYRLREPLLLYALFKPHPKYCCIRLSNSNCASSRAFCTTAFDLSTCVTNRKKSC